MIRNHYHIDMDERISVYVPVRLYEITLKHRLLERLGGFSHLLLDALTLMPKTGISWVLDVTGFSPQQLHPILRRMEGLGLLKNKQLSQQGRKLSTWRQQLHGQTRSIWLDGHHDKHSFCGDASLGVVEVRDDQQFVIRYRGRDGMPRSWSCTDWNEDCERQKNRILRHPEQYMPTVFEAFEGCFVDTGFNANEWDISVRYVRQPTEYLALKVEIDPATLRPGNLGDFLVASPVLCLDTRYSLPEAAKAVCQELLPEDHDHLRSLSFGLGVSDNAELHDAPPSSWVWPEVDELTRQQAVRRLFEEVTILNSRAEAIFNREHELVDRWQCFAFDKANIMASLKEGDGVHYIRGDA